jgi:hypothetical protein
VTLANNGDHAIESNSRFSPMFDHILENRPKL